MVVGIISADLYLSTCWGGRFCLCVNTQSGIISMYEFSHKMFGIFMEQDIKEQFEKIDRQFEKMNQRFDELMEFLAENMVMRSEFDAAQKQISFEFQKVNSSTEYIHAELKDIINRLDILEKRTWEDVNAHNKEIVSLRDRVAVLEMQVRAMQMQTN